MRVLTAIAAICAAASCMTFTSPAQSADVGRILRSASGGGSLAFRPSPAILRAPLPRLRPGGTPHDGVGRNAGACRGLRCIKTGAIRDNAHKCLAFTARRHGRCISLDKPDHGNGHNDSDVTNVIPGKVCGSARKRRGKHCITVSPPVPPRQGQPLPVNGNTPSIKPPARARDNAPAPVPQSSSVHVADGPYRPHEVVVLVADPGADIAARELELRFKIVAEERSSIALAGGSIIRFRIPDNRRVEAVVGLLANAPRVLLAQQNFTFTTSDAGDAGAAPGQYALARMKISGAHAATRGRGVRVAVLDTGIDQTHPEISGSIGASFDALDEGPVVAGAHGTAVAGIISARSSLKGVAPEASILSVRAFASNGKAAPQSTSVALAKGIDWAVANDARLLNLSFAGPDDPLLARVIASAARRGSIFVAAAGNGGPEAAPAYPAAYDDVIAVTATDAADQIFVQSGQGAHIAIAAPGVDILTAAPGGRYDMSTGTSLAAAHVSGVIALLLERKPSLTLSDIRNVLSRTAQRLTGVSRNRTGSGLIDATAATNAVAPPSSKVQTVARQ